jgi:hypothetical protein
LKLLLWIALVGLTSAASNVRVRGDLAPTHTAVGRLPGGAQAGQVFVEADFENGIIPVNWLVRRARSAGDSLPASWFVTSTDPIVAQGDGNFMSWVNWDSTQVADEWLITPRVDLSDSTLTDVSIDFLRVYHDPEEWAAEATLQVLASRDDGVTYPDTLYRITEYSHPGREYVSIDLSGYVGTSAFRAAFRYSGRGGDSVGIDNVRVRAGLPVWVQSRSWSKIKNGRLR